MRGLGVSGGKGWTRPERRLYDVLARLGLEPEHHARDLRGTPDIVLRGERVAIFVHGCFWHGCERHYRAPAARAEFWAAKLERNRTRDADAARELEAAGWTVIIAWEHDDEHVIAGDVLTLLEKRRG